MRIVCDNQKCTGCLACVVTCLDHHYPGDAKGAVAPRRYKKSVQPSGYTKYDTYSCYHCKSAPCAAVCPVKAIQQENGWVMVNREVCIGCGQCVKACPFGIPQRGHDGKMVKCDGCGGEPNCVKVCPNGALTVEPQENSFEIRATQRREKQ